MEVDLPLGWKPLNLEHYDGTTNLDKHLDVFLSLDNLYTNDDMILCRSQKRHLHAIKDLDVNYVNIQSLRSLPPIAFTNRDFKGINPINQDNHMVVSIVIANFMVSKVPIYQGSSIDILY
ncbi:hypothetical protein JHK87_043266 [Glycine soja]|nr:hypothetical protein JHK87_043266 [Glycine soja]